MSRVFMATETALNRSVVIKVIAPDLLEGMSAERFAREVQLAARLQQANIVPVLAAGDANGLPFYTMPFVRGESLRARMANSAPISVADAIHILRDVARALAYAHGEGIVHRDIKPENVLLSGGAAVVTDFGIAKAIDISRTRDGDHPGGGNLTLTRAGSSLGTPAYMSPEQAAGDPSVDHRADIYAWGLIAWELLAGRHPFAGRPSLQALVAAQMSETPAPLSSVRQDVSPVLSDLVQRCLEKEPSRRPASATELLAQLDQATSTGSRAAAQTPTPTPTPANRRRGVLIGGAVLATAVAVAALMRWRTGHGAGETTADKSLAIIPFSASSSDSGTAYIGEGIADEVTNELSQIPGLRLAGRSSAARYSGKRASAQEIGKGLGVAAVLDGTVRRAGDRIRVTAELSNVSDGNVAWRESYDRATADIFAVQDEIARAIAGRLQVTLNDAGRSAARGTADAAAYDLYLKGMYLYRRRGLGITDAIAALEQATGRDSTFARAWAALAQALTVSPSYVDMRAADVLPRARAAAERAVRLDPNSSDAHNALGFVRAEAFEWPEAEAELNRAIALDANAAEPRYRLGYTLMNQRRPAEAIPILQAAVARDRLYYIATSYLGWAEVEDGRFAEGLQEGRLGLAMEPNAISALSVLAYGYAAAGPSDSARFYAHRILATPSVAAGLGTAAYALARAGSTDEAKAIAARLEATPPNTWTRWTALTLAYAGLRDSARTIGAMEHAAAGDGDQLPLFLSRLPGDLPNDPRVDAVLRRFRLDPARFRTVGVGKTQ